MAENFIVKGLRKSINATFISLIPKKVGVEDIKDFSSYWSRGCGIQNNF
jgi:hypothetical protein